jgi:hypothetical protein
MHHNNATLINQAGYAKNTDAFEKAAGKMIPIKTS